MAVWRTYMLKKVYNCLFLYKSCALARIVDLMADKKIIGIGVAIIVIIALVAIVAFTGNQGSKAYQTTSVTSSTNSTATSTQHGSAQHGSVVLSITDPPEVPPGTNSLILSYTSIMVHENGQSNTTGFVNTSGSGSIDLLSLTNVSQIIAVANVPANTSFDSVVFTGASAKITISNATYNVTIPGSRLQIKIQGTLSSANGSALINLSPSVVQIYGQSNANQSVFVMVPFAKAIVTGSIGSSAVSRDKVGYRANINASIRAKLETNSSISISSTSLAEQGNDMVISVAVKNSGNSSVVLKHVFIRGMMASSFNGIVGADATAGATGDIRINTNVPPSINISIGSNTVIGSNSSSGSEAETHANSSVSTGHDNGSEAHSSLDLNSTIEQDLHVGNVTAKVRALVNGTLEFEHEMHSSLNFLIMQNATLSLPQSEAEAEGQNGYTLAPGANITLAFDAQAVFGESSMGVQLIQNQTYAVTVQGESGATATANATAT